MLESKMRKRKTTLVPQSMESLERTPSFSAKSKSRKLQPLALTQEILLQALEEVRPSVSTEERQKYSRM